MLKTIVFITVNNNKYLLKIVKTVIKFRNWECK